MIKKLNKNNIYGQRNAIGILIDEINKGIDEINLSEIKREEKIKRFKNIIDYLD